MWVCASFGLFLFALAVLLDLAFIHGMRMLRLMYGTSDVSRAQRMMMREVRKIPHPIFPIYVAPRFPHMSEMNSLFMREQLSISDAEAIISDAIVSDAEAIVSDAEAIVSDAEAIVSENELAGEAAGGEEERASKVHKVHTVHKVHKVNKVKPARSTGDPQAVSRAEEGVASRAGAASGRGAASGTDAGRFNGSEDGRVVSSQHAPGIASRMEAHTEGAVGHSGAHPGASRLSAARSAPSCPALLEVEPAAAFHSPPAAPAQVRKRRSTPSELRLPASSLAAHRRAHSIPLPHHPPMVRIPSSPPFVASEGLFAERFVGASSATSSASVTSSGHAHLTLHPAQPPPVWRQLSGQARATQWTTHAQAKTHLLDLIAPPTPP